MQNKPVVRLEFVVAVGIVVQQHDDLLDWRPCLIGDEVPRQILNLGPDRFAKCRFSMVWASRADQRVLFRSESGGSETPTDWADAD
jgi:hypothetical protein